MDSDDDLWKVSNANWRFARKQWDVAVAEFPTQVSNRAGLGLRNNVGKDAVGSSDISARDLREFGLIAFVVDDRRNSDREASYSFDSA